MKTSDVLVIGTGNGGCQVADYIEALEVCPCLFANSAKGDLNSLVYAKPEDTIHFTGASGSGSNREKGKAFALANMEEIFRRVESTRARHIYIITSTAGGTGSGSSLTIARELGIRYHEDQSDEYLESLGIDPAKRFTRYIHIVAITPSENDGIGIRGMENNIEFLTELKELCEAGIVRSFTFLDNTTTEKIEEINKKFGDDFAEMINVPTSTDGFGKAIDREDLSSMQTSSGMFLISEFILNEHNNKSVHITNEYMALPEQKGCENLLVVSNSKEDTFSSHIKAKFGEPSDQSKVGIAASPRNMAYVFGMDFPESVIRKAVNQYKNKQKVISQQKEKQTSGIEFNLEEFKSKQANKKKSNSFLANNINTTMPETPTKKIKTPAEIQAERLAERLAKLSKK